MDGPEGWEKWTTDTYDKWGLVFDGVNLHIKGNLYANGIRIHDTIDGEGFTFYEYFNDLFKTAAEIIGDIRHSASKLGELNSKNNKIFKNF